MAKSDFMGLMRSHPDMAFQVTKLIGFRFKTFRLRVEQLLFKSTSARLAFGLLELARQHGVRDERGVLLPLRLSQSDIANLIGVTRESVNLALADFRRQGLVTLEGRSIRLPEPQALEDHCRGQSAL
jgi:CRP/FNR family transcriptional regulator